MSDLSARVHELRALESLSSGATVIHRVHPLAKLVSTFVFIVSIASFGRYDFARLVPFLFYPFIVIAVAELPYKLLLSRMLIALPFCLFAGVVNVLLDTETAMVIGGVAVSYGVLSLASIILKMYLCVMAAMILIAVTPFSDLTASLRRLRVPMILVAVFEVTFRYINVLFEETYSMITAYRLRAGKRKTLDIRHMGPFAGHLFLRSFDRAERVHAAMRCRGYSLKYMPQAGRQFRAKDTLALAVVCIPAIVLRVLAL